MKKGFALVILAVAFAAAGCGSGEVSNKDQAEKMTALHNAEAASQAKDGIKSE